MKTNPKHYDYRLYSITLFIFFALSASSQVIVQDSSFEGGHPNNFWVEHSLRHSGVICDGGCGAPSGVGPLSGTHFAWLGGSTVHEKGSVEQTVSIPSADGAELTFWLKTPAVAANFDDYFMVLMDSTQVFFINSTDSSTYKNEYKKVTVDISSFADGQQHILKFLGNQTGNPGVTSYLVDDVSIRLSVGYEQNGIKKSIRIFPNPASSVVNIRFSGVSINNILICTVEGKILIQKDVANTFSVSIPLEGLSRGFFLLIAEGDGGFKVCRKLIVE